MGDYPVMPDEKDPRESLREIVVDLRTQLTALTAERDALIIQRDAAWEEIADLREKLGEAEGLLRRHPGIFDTAQYIESWVEDVESFLTPASPSCLRRGRRR